jgi:hypothetical protein
VQNPRGLPLPSACGESRSTDRRRRYSQYRLSILSGPQTPQTIPEVSRPIVRGLSQINCCHTPGPARVLRLFGATRRVVIAVAGLSRFIAARVFRVCFLRMCRQADLRYTWGCCPDATIRRAFDSRWRSRRERQKRPHSNRQTQIARDCSPKF